jgi:Tfp pilus assembly major pilin PilA
MPGVAVVVVLAVSVVGKYYQGIEDFSAPRETTALYAQVRRNATAKGKQRHAKQCPTVSTVALMNK